jgi:hypothetical protein
MGPGRYRLEFAGKCFLHIAGASKGKWTARMAFTDGSRVLSAERYERREDTLAWGWSQYVQYMVRLTGGRPEIPSIVSQRLINRQLTNDN